MSELSEDIVQQVLELPPEERIKVLERLLSSLEPRLSRIDQLWVVEAEDRLDAYERGEIKAIPAEDVFNSIKNRKR